jgi:carboxylate-amine ligase
MTVGSTAAPLGPLVDSGVPTVGVEDELFLLRPDGCTATVAPALLGRDHPGVPVAAEFTQCQVETTTGICRELAIIGVELLAARQAVARAAADLGALVTAVGTPPVDEPGFAALTDDERYRRLVGTVPGLTGEVITCAGQVHVGVASRDLGVAVLARLRPWLPVLLALTGNSPLRGGRDTGWSSSRFVAQQRWPTFVPPPRCADASDYDERVAALIRSGAALDERGVYFWARLSPRYPTVEIRIADTCLTVGEAVLLAGLCRAAVMTAVADERAGRPVPVTTDDVLVRAARSAARHGLSGRVVDLDGDSWRPASAVLPALMAVLAPALAAAGDLRRVGALLDARLRRGSGADVQRMLWLRGAEAAVQALAALGVDDGDDAD